MIKTFDKTNCRLITAKMLEALKPLADELGISFKQKSGSFLATNFTLKIEASVKNENGEVVLKEVEEFKKYANLYGFKPEDLGRQFEWGGKTYAIHGLSARSRQYPILGKDSKGRIFKFPESIKSKILNLG